MSLNSMLDFNEAASATDVDFLNDIRTGVANDNVLMLSPMLGGIEPDSFA